MRRPYYRRPAKLNRLQQALEDNGSMRVVDLARAVGTHQGHISRVVNGQAAASRELAEAMADVLGIDPADVMWPNGRATKSETAMRDE